MSAIVIPGANDQGLGLALPVDMSEARWIEIGWQLAEANRRLPWLIADWAAYGANRWGGKYDDAGHWGGKYDALIEATDFSCQTLRDMAWVGRRFELSRRRDNLSFSHHREVAALDPDDQDALLDRAEREDWPRRKLRTEVARFKRGAALGANAAAPAFAGRRAGFYPVIYADPPWRFEAGESERSASAHYPVMTEDRIAALPVAMLAAPDAVLYLWATAPCLEQALRVMTAWDFGYVTHLVWRKDRVGTGYRVRSRHELLLVGARGRLPAPAPGDQPESVIDAPRGAHSAKPAAFRDLIDRAYPGLPKIELFARGEPAPGWDAWGNEAPPAPAPSRAEGAA